MNHEREIDKKMLRISDQQARRLFDELYLVTGVDPRHYVDFTVFQFLQQCIYPNGAQKPVRITRRCIDVADDFDTFVLLKKVGKVDDGLHRLLRSFLDWRPENLDHYSGTSVYVFLNKMLIPSKAKPQHRYFHQR